MCSTLHTCPSQNTTLTCVTNQITDEYYSGERWVPTTCLSDQDSSQLSLSLNRISSIHPSIQLSLSPLLPLCHSFSWQCPPFVYSLICFLFFMVLMKMNLSLPCPFSKLPYDYSSILPFHLSSNHTYVTVCPCAEGKIIIIKMSVGNSAYLPLNT